MGAEAESSSRSPLKWTVFFQQAVDSVIDDVGIDLEDDWLVSCIRCEEGGGNLLSCCKCSIYLHEGCIAVDDPPDVDELGMFWCPVCNHGRAVDSLKETRKRVVETKNALSAFMGCARFCNLVGDDPKTRWIDAMKRKNGEMDLDRVVRTEGLGGSDAKMVRCDRVETMAKDHAQQHIEGVTLGIESCGISTTKGDAVHDKIGEVQKKDDDIQVTASKEGGILLGKKALHLDSCCEEGSVIYVYSSDEEVLENESGIQKKDDGRVPGSSQDQGILHGKLVQPHLSSCCVEETVTAPASDGRNHESLEEQTQLTPDCQKTTPCSPREKFALTVHGNEFPFWTAGDLVSAWESVLGKRKKPCV